MNKARYQAIFNSENQNWWYKGRRKLLVDLMKDLYGWQKRRESRRVPAANFLSEDIGRDELLTGPTTRQMAIPQNRNIKILDIGCGTGRNIMLLQNFGETFGVDISTEAINFCKQRNIKNVQLISKNKYNFPDNSFDLITCLDILEHVENEKEILSDIKRVLKKDGHVIFFVPASPRIWSKLDTDSHHKRRYTKKSLTEILEKNGFQIRKMKYFNYLLYLPMYFVRLFQKTPLGKGNTYGVRPDSESGLVNKLLEPIFTLDIKSLKYFSPRFGVSLFAICQKS